LKDTFYDTTIYDTTTSTAPQAKDFVSIAKYFEAHDRDPKQFVHIGNIGNKYSLEDIYGGNSK